VNLGAAGQGAASGGVGARSVGCSSSSWSRSLSGQGGWRLDGLDDVDGMDDVSSSSDPGGAAASVGAGPWAGLVGAARIARIRASWGGERVVPRASVGRWRRQLASERAAWWRALGAASLAFRNSGAARSEPGPTPSTPSTPSTSSTSATRRRGERNRGRGPCPPRPPRECRPEPAGRATGSLDWARTRPA